MSKKSIPGLRPFYAIIQLLTSFSSPPNIQLQYFGVCIQYLLAIFVGVSLLVLPLILN